MMIHEFDYEVVMENPPCHFTIWNSGTRVLKSIMKIYYRANKTLNPIWHFTSTYAKSYFLLASWQFQI